MSVVILDVTAGERNGLEALEAAAHASLEPTGTSLIVVGDETTVTRALEGMPHNAERIRVAHAPDAMDRRRSARRALEDAPRSAIRVGLEAAARTPGAAFISAGHPGAIVLEANRRLTLLKSVRRAALAAVYPTLKLHGLRKDPFGLLLDVGATVDCKARELVSFAAMGAAYAQKISSNSRPRVALLANSKRLDALPAPVAAAHEQLEALADDFEYIGFVRADHLTRGDADVIVTDGFTGDVVIRTLEGIVSTAQALLKRADERFSWRLGMSMLGSGIERLRELVNWENYGGAPLLGFDKPVVLTQANSHQRAFVNAIRLARKIQRTDLVDALTQATVRLPSDEEA